MKVRINCLEVGLIKEIREECGWIAMELLISGAINKGLKMLSLPKSFISELSSRSKAVKEVCSESDITLFCAPEATTEDSYMQSSLGEAVEPLLKLVDKNKKRKADI